MSKSTVCTDCNGSGLLKVTRYGLDYQVSDEEVCPFCNGSGGLTRDEAASNAAIKTLEHLGYEYNGGEQWKPPIGENGPTYDAPLWNSTTLYGVGNKVFVDGEVRTMGSEGIGQKPPPSPLNSTELWEKVKPQAAITESGIHAAIKEYFDAQQQQFK